MMNASVRACVRALGGGGEVVGTAAHPLAIPFEPSVSTGSVSQRERVYLGFVTVVERSLWTALYANI